MPDVVIFGKGLGSGVPISAIVALRAILDFQEAFALITTTGNSLCTSVARAVLDTIESEALIDAAGARGEQLMQGLRDVKTRHPLIGDVRGRGLAIGFELVQAAASKSPAIREAAKVALRAYELGVAFTYVGLFSNVPELTPSLTLTGDQASFAIEVIEQAIDDVENGRVSDDEVAVFAGW